jgi:aryl-alcohol dehydrogenase-like predicted oxidoreductase
VVTYSPLGVGFLSGRYTPRRGRTDRRLAQPRGLDAPDQLDEVFRVVDGLRPIAEREELSMGELALAWNIAQPG